MRLKIETFDEKYLPEFREVFSSSIHRNANTHYTMEQLNAWAPREYDQESWNNRIRAIRPFIALLDGIIVGYADLQDDGYIDHFFVRGGLSGKGIGTALMTKIIELAKTKHLN